VFRCRVLGPLAVVLVGDGGDLVLDVGEQRCGRQPGDGSGDEFVVDEGPGPVLGLVAREDAGRVCLVLRGEIDPEACEQRERGGRDGGLEAAGGLGLGRISPGDSGEVLRTATG
jgi:hypothetical protein